MAYQKSYTAITSRRWRFLAKSIKLLQYYKMTQQIQVGDRVMWVSKSAETRYGIVTKIAGGRLVVQNDKRGAYFGTRINISSAVKQPPRREEPKQ